MRRLLAMYGAVALLCCAATGAPSPVPDDAPRPGPDGDVLVDDGPQSLFGSQIGAWPMLDDRYDGHPMLNYRGSCPICPQLARDAGITVVRWGIWNVFDGMTPPKGQSAPPLQRPQFDGVVDGIRNQLGAQVLLELQPGISDPTT